MKIRFLFALLGCTSLLPLHADDETNLFAPEEEMEELLDEFLRRKEEEPLPCKKNLRISGDVRLEYDRYHEVVDGVTCRGTGTKLPDQDYFIEANIFFDYRTDCNWAAFRCKFKNKGGLEDFSGSRNGINLERALIGYCLFDFGYSRWIVEAGRWPLFERFDSEVQFGARFDGLFTKLTYDFARFGKWYIQEGIFAVDNRFDQYASIAETGLTDIGCSGLYAKISYVDWLHNGQVRDDGFHRDPVLTAADKKTIDTIVAKTPANPALNAVEQQLVNEALKESLTAARLDQLTELDKPLAQLRARLFWRHQVVQFLLGYKVKNFLPCKDLKIYGAYLNNLLDPRLPCFPNVRGNLAGYVGFQLGEAVRCRDWAVKAVYMYVGALSILEADNNGIGRGNVNDDVLVLNGFTPGLEARFVRGGTNYQGISAEAAYMITDSLTCKVMYQRAVPADKSLGGDLLFTRYMVRFICAF